MSLRDMCQGRWPSLLTMFGVDRRFLNGKHGPCPMCGQGKDRFRFDDKNGAGTWICSVCGSGDGFSLLMKIKGWDYKTVATEVEGVVGKAEVSASRRARDVTKLRDDMNRIWSSGRPIERGDAVAYYLECRGIDLDAYPASLRFVDRLKYPGPDGQYYPAMIAKVVEPDGKPVNVHRTYLSGSGAKASVEKPKLVMPGSLGKGSAIRLGPVAPMMGIAEGIETALSASIIWKMPVWAAVSSGMLMAWEPPPEATEIFIFGDNDGNYAGQAAAYALAHRLSARGTPVSVQFPPDKGDWNDAIAVRMEAA